jgi:drug/metabolite transporter (DMT)-like permease
MQPITRSGLSGRGMKRFPSPANAGLFYWHVFVGTSLNQNHSVMRKIGVGIFAAGVIILLAVGIKSIKEKKNQTNIEEVAQSHPFPWYPLIGGILVASGIIIMSRKEKA